MCGPQPRKAPQILSICWKMCSGVDISLQKIINNFKIIKPAPKIVKLTAGAKKNSRKEVKRVILRVFLYMFSLFFEVFGIFSTMFFYTFLFFLYFQASPHPWFAYHRSYAGHLVSALLVADWDERPAGSLRSIQFIQFNWTKRSGRQLGFRCPKASLFQFWIEWIER